MGFTAAIFLFQAVPVEAGFFSNLLHILVGEGPEANENASSEAHDLFLPLLGSSASSPVFQAGVGGLADDVPAPLPTVQDSALVGSKNPAGILSGDHPDQILVYTVQSGDTPGHIAKRFGITLNTLLWANNLYNPNLIKVGDELIILPVSGVKYEVKSGDTLESIAQKFKGDSAEIQAFNGLAIGEKLQAGGVIIIPDGEIAFAPQASRAASLGVLPGLPEYRGYYFRPIIGGRRSRGIHGFNGVDLAQNCRLPVFSAAEGEVLIVKYSGWNGGYGKYVVVAHPNGTQTLYAHLSSILASVGQRIAQASQIATVGSTGNSTGCHVHFEIRGAKNPF